MAKELGPVIELITGRDIDASVYSKVGGFLINAATIGGVIFYGSEFSKHLPVVGKHARRARARLGREMLAEPRDDLAMWEQELSIQPTIQLSEDVQGELF